MWVPLPEPPGPDPATGQEFALLAVNEMVPLVTAAEFMAGEILALDVERGQREVALDTLRQDLVAGALELAAIQTEAAADPLTVELTQASEQDAALLAAANEAADEAGEAALASASVSALMLPSRLSSPP